MRVKIDKHDVKSCKVSNEKDCETGVHAFNNGVDPFSTN